ncbi:VRR-NUC domain-containing protein [Halomonas salifodinae]|uniref:VRR-NUC domain-containing protein n=1 Tax=Halomonas salifodinae TaxID=438745 RepID=UPI0033BB84C3
MNSLPIASLSDPRYYLANFRAALAWVAARYDDLLGGEERHFLSAFAALPEAAQALLVRLVMRRGEHFRTSRLGYAEIGDTDAALAPLIASGLVEADPELGIEELCRQLRLAELRQAFATPLAEAGLGRATKAELTARLPERLGAPRRYAAWWPEAPDRLVRLAAMPTCERLRLMFFGNLRQDWSEFVLTELGHQRFETVPFGPESRAFRHAEELDAYLALHRLGERLEAGEAVSDLAEALSESLPEPAQNPWLASRRQRLALRLGREAERQGETQLALSLYAQGGEDEALVRRLRLLERLGEHRSALTLARPAQAAPASEAQRQALVRLVPRLEKRLGLAVTVAPTEPAPEPLTLTLPQAAGGVERAVAEHLATPEAPVRYVENGLITGLFGLLCWEAIFAPLPGAFFHPFQSGPADLYRPDFVTRRRARFDACLARLDTGDYREAIRATWAAKRGLASPFVAWELLDQELLELALASLPPAHLRACFERLLADLKANRAGLPDLIQCFPERGDYRLIEVKGPGDRLQDNQRRWLAFFHDQGMPVVVCRVRWA